MSVKSLDRFHHYLTSEYDNLHLPTPSGSETPNRFNTTYRVTFLLKVLKLTVGVSTEWTVTQTLYVPVSNSVLHFVFGVVSVTLTYYLPPFCSKLYIRLL